MKLSATHEFNCIVLMVKLGRTSCEDIPPALLHMYVLHVLLHLIIRLITYTCILNLKIRQVYTKGL